MRDRRIQKFHSKQNTKADDARAKRAMNMAMLPLATLAITGCSSMGTLPTTAANDDPKTLLAAEQTIHKARGIGYASSQVGQPPASANDAALKYAQAVDAALNAQSQNAGAAAGKIDPTKKPAAAPVVAPAVKTAGTPNVAAAPAGASAKTGSSLSMYVAPVEHADPAHADPKAEPKVETKVEPKIEPKAEAKAEPKIETKAEPKAEAGGHAAADSHDSHNEGHGEAKVETKVEPKAEAKVETKIEPKIEAKTEVKPAPKLASVELSETKIEKVEKNEKSIAAAMPELKGAAAMGAMTVTTPPAEERLSIAGAVEPEVTMEAIVEQLRKQVRANPRQLNVAMALSLLESAAPEGHAGESAASPLSEADQKIVGSITAAVNAVMQTPANASLSEKAAPIIAASKKLEGDGDLQLPKLVLTSRVDSYGVDSPVEARFENGKRHTVIIYCEVANFSTRKTDDGLFTTKLSQQDSLITEDGLLVWRPNPEEVEDRSRNQRHDFYLVKKLTLPETLAIGKYTLRMSVTDKQTNKISMVSIPVEIFDK